MVLGWFGGGGDVSIEELIARKKYARAIELLRAEFKRGHRSAELRLQMVEALVRSGSGKEAVPILAGLADEAARRGEGGKAIALLKRIESIEPGRSDISTRLAKLIHNEPIIGAEIGMDIAASPTSAEPVTCAPESYAPELGQHDPEAEAADTARPAAPLASPLFSDFAVDELLVLMSRLRLLTRTAGDMVLSEGAPGDSMFVLASGSVKAYVHNAAGSYVKVREMHEGDFFGEIALLSDMPRSATIVASSHCELLELDRASLASIATTHPRVRDVVRNFAAERTGSAEETAARASTAAPKPGTKPNQAG